MKMVEVFKTNITNQYTAASLTEELQQLFPRAIINFDLDDCDRILRVMGENLHAPSIAAHLVRKGHLCEVLE